MMVKPLIIVFSILTSFTYNSVFTHRADGDRICGKWMSEEKNLIVLVYKDGDDFRAKIVWFNAQDDSSKPMDARTDYKNPDKALRSRKLIGMNVLDGLKYVPKTDSWEDGKIYDAMSGRTWNSSAYITPGGEMKVTGYWHFKFIGRTMTFTRIN